jgi:AraC family transcriptional regulator of adaptative response/methylated-DNA-[protein]-cysteine methyltransferase
MIEFLRHDGLATLVEQLERRYPEAVIIEDNDFMAENLGRVAALIDRPASKNDLSLDMRGSDFELKVWNALRDVAAGTTVTYGDIATRSGVPKQAREVGEACAANPLAVVVPCHRVVKKNGSVSGYRWGVKRKRELLRREASELVLAA